MDGHAWRLGVLAGHGAEQSPTRTTYGGDSTAAGRGSTTRPGEGMRRRRRGRGRDDEIDVVDQKVEDEQRNRSIYIGRDPLVPACNTNRY